MGYKEEILENSNYLVKNPSDFKGKWNKYFNNDILLQQNDSSIIDEINGKLVNRILVS